MLTQDQLTAVDRHLRKENWLLNEDLITELTDHYVAGVDERMAHGSSFETAIREIHAGFGGRKGLLAMEESFQKTQAENFARLIRQRFTSYFRMPRLLTTGLLFLLVHGLMRLFPAVENGNSWPDAAFYVALGGLALLYVIAFIHLIYQHKQKSATRTVTQFLWPLLQALNLLVMMGFYANLFLPVDQLVADYPLLATLLITPVLVFELAISELLLERIVDKRKAKLT